MTSYRITPDDTGISVELAGVGEKQQQLLAAFGECQAGQCSCPTTEYEKVDAMEVRPSQDAISIALRAKPGTQFDTDQLAACLDYTVEHSSPEPSPRIGPPVGEK